METQPNPTVVSLTLLATFIAFELHPLFIILTLYLLSQNLSGHRTMFDSSNFVMLFSYNDNMLLVL